MIARWHQCGTTTSQMLARASFSAVCLTVFPFEFRPRTFTIGFYGKKSIISELMILECSFPLSSFRINSSPTSAVKFLQYVLTRQQMAQIISRSSGLWSYNLLTQTTKIYARSSSTFCIAICAKLCERCMADKAAELAGGGRSSLTRDRF